MHIERYMARVSGPLLDRIDLHLEVPTVPFQELSGQADGTASKVMRNDVARARQAQRDRFGADGDRLNSRMNTRQLRKHCELNPEGRGLLQNAMDGLGLSARAHDRILRVARTVADLEGSSSIKAEHLVEAIGYRSLDRKLWKR
jgi:magnesium chelatase family protein